MGLNCVAVLLNDMCHEVQRDGGSLGRAMSRAMQNWNRSRTRDLDGDFGVGHVISRDHADAYQVVVVHGNTGCLIQDAKDLPFGTLENMAACLNRHGWPAKPPPKRRKRPALQTD